MVPRNNDSVYPELLLIILLYPGWRLADFAAACSHGLLSKPVECNKFLRVEQGSKQNQCVRCVDPLTDRPQQSVPTRTSLLHLCKYSSFYLEDASKYRGIACATVESEILKIFTICS